MTLEERLVQAMAYEYRDLYNLSARFKMTIDFMAKQMIPMMVRGAAITAVEEHWEDEEQLYILMNSPLSGVWVGQVPCDNCTLGMVRSTTCDDGSVDGGHPGLACDEHCPVPCPSCGGSGTVWPRWATTVMMGVVVDMPEPDQALDRLMEAQEEEA
ncbi:hypothetical protein LCGC14_0397040 [marine sediment metagenome]|uniref:Uncharacterized protein n=1 Tax=marine sediment metagenome TaxID=412755 RepID=A0A0F9VJP4_9ZZZZ